MKKLRTNIDKWFDKQNEYWQSLPVCKQHQFTLYFFAGYLLLTAFVILKVWYDRTNHDNKMVIEHIDNPALKNGSPVLQKDTL